MEHHNHSEPNPILNFVAFILQILFFIDANVTADEFRSWSSWTLGVIVSVLLIIINFPKAKETLKKKDK